MNKVLLTGVLLALSVTAYADPLASSGGWYAGASAGRTHYSGTTMASDKVTPLSLDHETAAKAFMGYRLDANWAAEAGFATLGTYHGVRGQGEFLDVLAIMPMPHQFDLFAKAGVTDMKVKGAADQSNKSGGNYGVGFFYHFNPKVALRGEFERFDKLGPDLKANVASIGIQMGF